MQNRSGKVTADSKALPCIALHAHDESTPQVPHQGTPVHIRERERERMSILADGGDQSGAKDVDVGKRVGSP